MIIGYDPYGGTMNQFDVKGIIEEVAKSGYDAINLPLKENFVDPESEEQLQRLEDMLKSAGISTPSVCVAPFVWTTPGKVEETQNRVDIAIGVARRFNAQLLTMWPNLPKEVSKADALETLAENMKASVPRAHDAGYPIAFEFEKGCTIDNYIESIDFIQSTDSRIRIVADTYHIYNDKADPYKAAVAMKGLIGEVHFSGSDRGEPGSDTDEFDHEAFVGGILETGFDGPVMIQYKLEDPDSIQRACEFTKALFA